MNPLLIGSLEQNLSALQHFNHQNTYTCICNFEFTSSESASFIAPYIINRKLTLGKSEMSSSIHLNSSNCRMLFIISLVLAQNLSSAYYFYNRI